MQEKTRIAAIILAAGSSSRMGEGRHKLLLPLGGRTVLAHAVGAALASQAEPVLVVLGHQADKVRASLEVYADQPALTMIENADFEQGMSSSLRAGVRALMRMGENTPAAAIGGALIVLGDQPLMTTAVMDRLLTTKRATSGRIVVPLYDGRRGNPVLFDASLFPELLEVTGDEGGRRVVERHRQEIVAVELGDALANYDVDTWEAYQQVVKAWELGHEKG